MAMNPRLLRPRASGAFKPSDIVGLALWLDANDTATLFDATSGGSTPAADGAVARWTDKSSNKYSLTQGTANNRPLYRSASLNAKGGLEFDGSNDVLTSSSVSIAQALTYFVVCSHDDITGGQGNLFDGITTRVACGKGGGNGNLFLFAGASFSATNRFSSGVAAIAGGIANSTSSTLRFNGSQVATGNGGTQSLVGMSVGGFTVPNGSFWDGKIHEIVMYSSALSDSTCKTVETYLSKKWGITLA